MKKLIACVLALVYILSLSACDSAKQEQVVVFSFCGENELFAISNGVIVLGNTEEVFHGGDLEIIRTDLFAGITSYSTTFYTITNGEQSVILSNSVIDTVSSSTNINNDLGRISGDKVLTGRRVENTEDLKNNLWFELNTTDVNGKTSTYQLQLKLTEIASTTAE